MNNAEKAKENKERSGKNNFSFLSDTHKQIYTNKLNAASLQIYQRIQARPEQNTYALIG